MATLGNFPGQFPLVSAFTSGSKSINTLLKLEANGSATVGNSYTVLNGSNPVDHSFYGVRGKCVFLDPASSSNESSYFRSSDSNTDWGAGKSWIAWIKKGNGAAFNGVAFSNLAGSTGINMGINSAYTQLSVSIKNAAETITISLVSNTNWVDISDGKFHTVMYVAESLSSHKLYVDGILHDSSSTNLGSVGTGNRTHVGADSFSDGVNGWDGYIDEFACFSKAFTAAEAYAFGGSLLV